MFVYLVILLRVTKIICNLSRLLNVCVSMDFYCEKYIFLPKVRVLQRFGAKPLLCKQYADGLSASECFCCVVMATTLTNHSSFKVTE